MEPLLPEFREQIRADHDKYVEKQEKFYTERAESIQRMVEGQEEYQLRCVLGEKAFYSPDTKARMPGHIYSPEGEREFTRMSHLCEFHFDEITKEPDDPNG
jgi:hypothetical protein